MIASAPHRLRIDIDTLVANWRWLAVQSGRAACGAAIKADGYGLGARRAAQALAAAGCRDFFVATWPEAEAIADLGLMPAVLNGLRADDMAAARAGIGVPVLNTVAEAARWRDAGGGRCHAMIETGMNRLGLPVAVVAGGVLDGLTVDCAMSHLACADSDHAMNGAQRARFAAIVPRTGAARASLANSAGVMLGADYHFDLTRPGIALYGGVPRAEMAAGLRQVAFPEAAVLQRRRVMAGEAVGYDATFVAARDTEVAILSIGYADGYARALSGRGSAGGGRFPVLGRVSMDLTAVDVSADPAMAEGDWIAIDYDLAATSVASGVSQYELLTRLGHRFLRA